MRELVEFKYKYVKSCVICRYLRRHPHIKPLIINATMFNPQTKVSVSDLHRSFFIDHSISSVRNHMKKHILPLDAPKAMNVMKNDKEPEVIAKSAEAVVKSKREKFENTLDEFIDQFDEGLRNRQFKLTVKDGLTALKIKADIMNKNKDRKKDILKAMMGVRDERGGPAERTSTEE